MKKLLLVINILLISMSNTVSADNYVFNTTDDSIPYTHTVFNAAQMEADQKAKDQASLDSLAFYIKYMEELAELGKGKVQSEEQQATLQFLFDSHYRCWQSTSNYNSILGMVRGSSSISGLMEGTVRNDLNNGRINKILVGFIPSTIESCKRIQGWMSNPNSAENRHRKSRANTDQYAATITEKIKNPFYNLYEIDVYHSYEKNQTKGWEWALDDSNLEKVEKIYPKKITYYTSQEHPGYAIAGNFAFDMNGNLVYGIRCYRYLVDHDNSFQKRVYMLDYKNNKYGILKEPQATQLHIQHYLGIKRNAEAEKEFASFITNSAKSYTATSKTQKKVYDQKAKGAFLKAAFAGYDEKAAAFLKQLDIDHGDDLKEVDIRRIYALSFKVIFMNSKGQSTYTATAKVVPDGPFKAHVEVSDVKEDRSIKYTLMDQNQVSWIKKQLREGTYEVGK